MLVTVLSRARRVGVRAADVGREARAVLAAMDEASAELTVVLVDDPAIHDLNRDYRGKDRPTDVLAFAMREGPRVGGDESHLGDVIISLDTAARQAKEHRHTAAEEVRTLLIHGILHLLGYDHERSPAEARRMRAKERSLARLLIARRAQRAPS
jgi:probable rRNA maturation factor